MNKSFLTSQLKKHSNDRTLAILLLEYENCLRQIETLASNANGSEKDNQLSQLCIIEKSLFTTFMNRVQHLESKRNHLIFSMISITSVIIIAGTSSFQVSKAYTESQKSKSEIYDELNEDMRFSLEKLYDNINKKVASQSPITLPKTTVEPSEPPLTVKAPDVIKQNNHKTNSIDEQKHTKEDLEIKAALKKARAAANSSHTNEL